MFVEYLVWISGWKWFSWLRSPPPPTYFLYARGRTISGIRPYCFLIYPVFVIVYVGTLHLVTGMASYLPSTVICYTNLLTHQLNFWLCTAERPWVVYLMPYMFVWYTEYRCCVNWENESQVCENVQSSRLYSVQKTHGG